MNEDTQNTKNAERDPDFVQSETAMRRAAKRARQVAQQNDAYVVVYRDGMIVEEKMVQKTNEGQ